MSKRYKVKRFSSCYLMNWVDNKTNKELTALEIEEILHKQEKRIAELEEQLKNCIKPKFKIGQDVIVFDWSGQLRNGRVYEIQTNSVLHDKQQLITYLVDFYGNYEDDDQENNYYEEKEVFITREEAEAKLAESEDCKNMLYKCLTEKDIEIETKKEEIAELKKQLEEKEK